MELTKKKNKDTGRASRQPKFSLQNEGQHEAIAFVLNDKLEKMLRAYFSAPEMPPFDIYVDVVTGDGTLVVPMSVVVVGMDDPEGRLAPREDSATRQVAGGKGYLDLPMRQKSHGQETIWMLEEHHFEAWRKSREIEVLFVGHARTTTARVTTPDLARSVHDLSEKGVSAWKEQFPNAEIDDLTIAAVRSTWVSGIITGLQLACMNSSVQSEILLRENLIYTEKEEKIPKKTRHLDEAASRLKSHG